MDKLPPPPPPLKSTFPRDNNTFSAPYDEHLVTLYFGNNDLKTARVQVHRSEDNVEFTYHYILNSPMVLLSNGEPLSCLFTNVNTLAIFNISIIDVRAINAFCRHLLHKLKVDIKKNLPMDFDINETLFFRPNEKTIFRNSSGQKIKSLPHYGFHATVSLKIRGLEFRNLNKWNTCNLDNMTPNYIVKLLIYLDEVCLTDVEEEVKNIV